MTLVRTTLRLQGNLKKMAEKRAFEEDISLQEIFNRALASFLESEAQKEVKKIIFKTHNLGKPLDNIKRADFYSESI